MRLPMKCMVFLACWASALATPAKIGDGDLGGARTGSVVDSSDRDSKLLFTFITIAPEACTSTGGKSGICYSAADCTTLSGTPDGTCAKGLGVCCLITRTCGSTSAFRETTFTNPNYPSTEPANTGSCQLRITPLNDNICQLRLDFEEFTLGQPDNEGVCDEDFLQVVAGASNIPTICGDNTGQHMYVDVDPQFGSALVNVDTSSAVSKWKIKVTQIECTSAYRAPTGCLQYFNSTTGMFSTFNFDPNYSGPNTRQLADQQYGICIKSQPGYCSVTYNTATSTTFSLTEDATPGILAPGIPVPGVTGFADCNTDYLIIPGGSVADRFCGGSFPEVTTSVKPFNVFLVTDGAETVTDPAGVVTGDIANLGFKISYRMIPC